MLMYSKNKYKSIMIISDCGSVVGANIDKWFRRAFGIGTVTTCFYDLCLS